MMLCVALIWYNLFISICYCGGLESWGTGGNLVRADRNQYATWNENSYYSDCIWVFGGNDADDIYCYNLTTNSIIYWDNLDTTNSYAVAEASVPASVLITDGIDDYIYYATLLARLFRYHINDKNLTLLSSTLNSNSWIHPCMVQNPANLDELLMVEGDRLSSNNFAIYTISTNSFTFGQDVATPLDRPVCIVVNNKYFSSDPYWYLFEGQTTSIQRIDVSSNNLANEAWETLTTQLTTTDSRCDVGDNWDTMYAGGGILYDNLIYIIGGYDATDTEDNSCILTFNIIDSTVSYFGDFQQTMSRYAIIIAYDRMYIMGGCTGDTSTTDCTDLTSVFISNDLADPTRSPTFLPSNIPSTDPSQSPSFFPSTSPSNIPTTLPSAIPSNLPTINPSNVPSNYPTSPPSYKPSNNPTTQPSSLPTTQPSVLPSDLPSIQPSLIPSAEPTTPRTLKPSLQPSEIPSNPPTVTPTPSGASDGSTKKDNGNNNSTLGISTDTLIILLIGLILGCILCVGVNLWWQRRSQKKIKKYLQDQKAFGTDGTIGINGTNENAVGGTGAQSPRSTDGLIGTAAVGGTGDTASMFRMISTNSIPGSENNDYLSALELVTTTGRNVNGGNNPVGIAGIAGNVQNNEENGGISVAAYELPQQPNVNMLQQTGGINMGEEYEDGDGVEAGGGVGPGNELAEGGGVVGMVGVAAPGGGMININLSDGKGMGTGVIKRNDWTKWTDKDVIEWVIRELKNAQFVDETIAQFIQQFRKLNMTGPILSIWVKQSNGDVMKLTQKFQTKLTFNKESMVWDVVVQAMLSLN